MVALWKEGAEVDNTALSIVPHSIVGRSRYTIVAAVLRSIFHSVRHSKVALTTQSPPLETSIVKARHILCTHLSIALLRFVKLSTLIEFA